MVNVEKTVFGSLDPLKFLFCLKEQPKIAKRMYVLKTI